MSESGATGQDPSARAPGEWAPPLGARAPGPQAAEQPGYAPPAGYGAPPGSAPAGYGVPPGYPPAAPAPGFGPGYGPPPGPVGQGSPGYGGYGGWPPAPGYNGLAIASLVTGIAGFLWVTPLLAIIFGFVARSQIRRTHQQGGGMALAGIILGFLWVAALAAIIIASIVVGGSSTVYGPAAPPA